MNALLPHDIRNDLVMLVRMSGLIAKDVLLVICQVAIEMGNSREQWVETCGKAYDWCKENRPS